MLIRVFKGGRNDGNIEIDERLLQYNHSSREKYLIETATLEKHLICDLIIRNSKPIL